MFEDMFTIHLKTCSMFSVSLKTCISNFLGHDPNVCSDVFPMFEDMFAQCLKTCLMFKPYLKAQCAKKH